MAEIVKSSGEVEEFSSEKVYSSIKKAGVSEEVASKLTSEVANKAEELKTTDDVHRYVFENLKTVHLPFADRYNLKHAILDLGPSGFPFEKYVGKLFEKLGYGVNLDQILQGECITHEVDLILTKDDRTSLVEAKFHNKSGIKTSVQVSLYVKSRFDDIAAGPFGKQNDLDQMWIVTNTKFSSDATTYANFKQIRLLGWDYPAGESLGRLIDIHKLHPVTALSLLNFDQKQNLINDGIVLCADISESNQRVVDLFEQMGLAAEHRQRLFKETKEIGEF